LAVVDSIVAAPVRARDPDVATMRLSLRAKGILAFVGLLIYVSIAGFLFSAERQKLLRVSVELEQLNERDSAVAKVSFAVDQSLLRLQGGLSQVSPPSSLGDDVALDVELIQSGLQLLQQFSPEFDDDIALLGKEVAALRRTSSQGQLLALQDAEREIARRLDELQGEARELRKAQWDRYYRIYDRMTCSKSSSACSARFFSAG
jgi:two-component system NtrC family sensor kinase